MSLPGTDRSIPFGATTPARDVLRGVDLTGRRAIVTGASSGIGVPTARALAEAGAEVVLAVRDLRAGQDVADRYNARLPRLRMSVRPLDLADQGSVRAFVSAWTDPLDVLVLNAGVMASPETRTAEGWELQFATNHLGHFALAVGLHDRLAAASRPGARSRVVVVSSVGHVNADVDLVDPDFHHQPYDPWVAYARSKTANILFAAEAARRWASDGIDVNALNPGRIGATGIVRHIGGALPDSFDPSDDSGVSVKNIEQGASTSVLLAGSPLVENVTGQYFEDCQVAPPHVPGVRRGIAEWALDPATARRLWALSEERTGRR